MKNIRSISALIALALTAALALGACGANEGSAPMGFKEISNDGVDYNLYVPDEWISNISTGVTAAYYSNVDDSNISMITFTQSDELKTPEKYWETYESSLAALFADFEYVSKPDKATLDGADAIQCTYTGNVADHEYTIMQLVAAKGTQIYIFTYTAASDKYDAHIEDVIAILDYFEFN